MDRIYVSEDIGVLRAGVCHGPCDPAAPYRRNKNRLAPGSDHALVWAELDLS
jgi:hypothetical protein